MPSNRHSFIAFYPSDWTAGTFRMSRLVRAVYFDVCLYNWDRAEPVPAAEVVLMLSDLEGQGQLILDTLIDAGKLHRDEHGRVWNERAMAEGLKALDLWTRKSQGGKKTQTQRAGVLQESGGGASIEPSPEPSPDPDPSEVKEGKPSSVEKSTKLRPSPLQCRELLEEWNRMALHHGLPQGTKMTPARLTALRCRIEELGIDEIRRALNLVPESPFLSGGGDRKWKASIDWFIKPGKAIAVLEGAYAGSLDGKPSGWRP